jgi:hypothetical protein
MDTLILVGAVMTIVVGLAISMVTIKVDPPRKSTLPSTITLYNASSQDAHIIIDGDNKGLVGWNTSTPFTIPSNKSVSITAVSAVAVLPEAKGFTGTSAVRSFVPPPMPGKTSGLGLVLKDELKTIILPSGGTDLYIIESGIVRSDEVNRGTLINDSQSPIQFIELGVNERRWPTEVSPPGTRISSVIARGTTWQVINPQDQWMVLGELKIPAGTQTLRWDGETILPESF